MRRARVQMRRGCVIAPSPSALTRLSRGAPAPPGRAGAAPPAPSALLGYWANPYNARVRGALITVRCDCGGIGYVPYGERWECPTCHRRWNTGQIPAEEYWGMMRDMRRMRITAIVTALAIVIPILALSTIAGIRILLLLPVVMSFWFLFYMPRWRRRVREQARSLRRWKLHPE
jgi:hypothetical protein